VAVAESPVLPPEPTVLGVAEASTEKVWATGWTARMVTSLSDPPPLQEAETVRVTVRSVSELFVGAV
jgi:hypothetical protein